MTYFRFNSPELFIFHTRDDNPSQDRFYMHTHAFAELFCFLEGEGVFHVEGTSYPLQPGDILLMRPGEAHYIQLNTDVPYERICINFDTEVFKSLDPDRVLMQPLFGRKGGKQNLYRAQTGPCLDILRRMTEPGPGNRLNLLGNLMLVLQQLHAAFSSGMDNASQPDTLEYRIIRYINKNLAKELSLQSLCEIFFVSRTQLCKCFKEVTGTSIGSYISVKRLLTARELLLQGIKPTEVFSACGYRDYSTFFRAYTKLFGHTPRQEQSEQYPLTPDTRILIGQHAGILSDRL